MGNVAMDLRLGFGLRQGVVVGILVGCVVEVRTGILAFYTSDSSFLDDQSSRIAALSPEDKKRANDTSEDAVYAAGLRHSMRPSWLLNPKTLTLSLTRSSCGSV